MRIRLLDPVLKGQVWRATEDQAPGTFVQVDKRMGDQIRTSHGYARVAGVTAFRYFHKAAGVASVAQVVKGIAAKADGRNLGELAAPLGRAGGNRPDTESTLPPASHPKPTQPGNSS